jgi:hypothetical protein
VAPAVRVAPHLEEVVEWLDCGHHSQYSLNQQSIHCTESPGLHHHSHHRHCCGTNSHSIWEFSPHNRCSLNRIRRCQNPSQDHRHRSRHLACYGTFRCTGRSACALYSMPPREMGPANWKSHRRPEGCRKAEESQHYAVQGSARASLPCAFRLELCRSRWSTPFN